MDDDFNTAGAMGALFDLVRGINAARDKNASEETLQPAQAKLLELTGVLGLTLAKSDDAQAPVMPFIDLLVEVRSEIRTQKLWALSDKIRDELKNLGVIIEDSRDGSTWHWE
jgi:cysteinyl-tRNA synthetase